MATCTTKEGSSHCTATALQFRPLGNRVLLRPCKGKDTMKGIVIPDSAKKEEERCEVMEVGPGIRDSQGNMIPMPVKKGDTVMVEKYCGQQIELEGEKYTIVRADEIIAIIES